MTQYVITSNYKANSGSVNGDKGGKHRPLTGLSSWRSVNAVLPPAFVSEVVPMIFRRREIRLNGEGKRLLFSNSSLTTRLTSLFSRSVIVLVSPTALFLSDVASHACYCLI